MAARDASAPLSLAVPASQNGHRGPESSGKDIRPVLRLIKDASDMRFLSLWPRSSERAPVGRFLPFPAAPRLRSALVGNSSGFKDVVAFPEDRWRDLPFFAPQLIAGELSYLLRLADHVFEQTLSFHSLDVAVFVLTRLGKGPLTASGRNTLWRAFRVPIYELYVDETDTVLASECEAHEGWHLRHPRLKFDLKTRQIVFQKHGLAANPVQTLLTADGLDSICPCGDDAPLLRSVRTVTHAIEIVKKPVRKPAAAKQAVARGRAATA
jgi:hypothetical protein